MFGVFWVFIVVIVFRVVGVLIGFRLSGSQGMHPFGVGYRLSGLGCNLPEPNTDALQGPNPEQKEVLDLPIRAPSGPTSRMV